MITVVHGGAGTRSEPPHLEALERAALAGCSSPVFSHLDAVERTVMAMEDEPFFNAGYGSVLNLDGEVEMDAAIMDGATGSCGAVTAVRDIRYPVCAARRVMEDTPHVIITGEGATRFARGKGFVYFNPISDKQKLAWAKAISSYRQGEQPGVCALTGDSATCDTVGCLAVQNGLVAAASSTGGTLLKHPGRVGDTGVIGAGIYAAPHGAAVCTGIGEVFIRHNTAAWAVNLLARGVNVHDVARAAMENLAGTGVNGGILVADAGGNVAAAYNSATFPVALVVDGRVIREFIAHKVNESSGS